MLKTHYEKSETYTCEMPSDMCALLVLLSVRSVWVTKNPRYLELYSELVNFSKLISQGIVVLHE